MSEQNNGTGFNARFTAAYDKVASGGLPEFAHNGLRLFLLISAIISFVWFGQIMPDLLLPPSVYPTLAPLVAGLVGVLSMEGAAFLWNNAIQREGLTMGQIWAARGGLLGAVLMAVITTIVAVVTAIEPQGVDRFTSNILAFVSGAGLAYYVGAQVALGVIYHTVLTDNATRGRHRAKVSAARQKASMQREQVMADGELAAHQAALGDVETVSKFGGLTTHQRLLEDAIKKYNIPPHLAGELWSELARKNNDVTIIDVPVGDGKPGLWQRFTSAVSGDSAEQTPAQTEEPRSAMGFQQPSEREQLERIWEQLKRERDDATNFTQERRDTSQ